MTNTEKGTKFEKAVEKVLQWIYGKYDVVTIAHNVKVPGLDIERQIDILITVKIHDLQFKIAVECKDYAGRISIGTLDAFISVLEEINATTGVMISSNGFSASTISKAKRKNITLYSLSDKIGLDDKELDIPIIIEEITPYESELEISLDRSSAITMKGERIIKDPLIINGCDVHELLKSNWESQKLELESNSKLQEVELPEIQQPYMVRYFINTKYNMTDEVLLKDLKVKLKLKIKYYILYLKELTDLKVLNNIHENKLSMFIDTDTVLSSFPNAKLTTKSNVDELSGIKAVIKIKKDFNIKIHSGSTAI